MIREVATLGALLLNPLLLLGVEEREREEGRGEWRETEKKREDKETLRRRVGSKGREEWGKKRIGGKERTNRSL